MAALALRIVLTPVLIGAASLVGRRFGQGVGGWLVALPLTSGPLMFLLALAHGHEFAAATALGALGGGGAEVLFCLGWLLLVRRGRGAALAAGSVGYAAGAAAVRLAPPAPLWLLAVCVAAAIAGGIAILGAVPLAAVEPRLPSRWDVPGRMAAGTAIVLVLTAVAPALGPRLSGLLATYPLLTAILAVSAHRLEGPRGGIEVLRGLLLGLFALVAFLVSLAGLLPRLGLPAFAVAVAAALALQALSLRFARYPATGATASDGSSSRRTSASVRTTPAAQIPASSQKP